MKIAHIGNTAGIASIIAVEQRKKGHFVDIFVFDSVTHRQFGGIRINYKLPIRKLFFHKKLASYDVWHYHYPYGALKTNLEKRHQHQTFLKHYHGDDLRRLGFDNDFCVVSTPDLLAFAPNGKWLPNPIDIEQIENIRKEVNSNNDHKTERLKMAHYPYYNIMLSHTDHYSKALALLEKQNKCDVVKIINVPHTTALRMIADCDIVVGKIIPEIGWFGKFELEGMALGKPVIAYVSDELYHKYKPPVYRTTLDTFEEDLAVLLNNDRERSRLSSEGLQYVQKYHVPRYIVETLERYYNMLTKT